MKLQDCHFLRLDPDLDTTSFDCGNKDLNEFLKKDSFKYMDELIGVTHVFVPKVGQRKIACFFTVSNDLLKLDLTHNSKKKKIKKSFPREKHLPEYPSVKIGRLGVHNEFHGVGLAYQLMDFVKAWFIRNNKTGCRFIIVDAYNEPSVLEYYQKNDFEFLLTEDNEKELNKNRLNENDQLNTRLMFFDLIRLK